jgi:DNA-binding transcriptional ArsR family regulator
MCAGGAEAVLANLNPVTTWKHPVLTFDNASDREMYLGGRGLLLVPGYFCPPSPVAFVGPRPRLVYPISWPDDASRTRGGHLAALLGNTRATILHSVVNGCTATELARRTGVTLATVCHHTAVLRNAGLIITRRQGTCTTHLIAPLGLRLLTG